MRLAARRLGGPALSTALSASSSRACPQAAGGWAQARDVSVAVGGAPGGGRPRVRPAAAAPAAHAAAARGPRLGVAPRLRLRLPNGGVRARALATDASPATAASEPGAPAGLSTPPRALAAGSPPLLPPPPPALRPPAAAAAAGDASFAVHLHAFPRHRRHGPAAARFPRAQAPRRCWRPSSSTSAA